MGYLPLSGAELQIFTLGIRSSNLSVTRHNALTTRLPVAPQVIILPHPNPLYLGLNLRLTLQLCDSNKSDLVPPLPPSHLRLSHSSLTPLMKIPDNRGCKEYRD